MFENLAPGTYQVKATADSFRPIATPFNVRRGDNRTTLRLALATIEQTVVVQDQNAADRRDNGFTQTLSQDEIDALPDDPDEMADELMRLAGPGAQIFVNGFRGGRLPPKDQIQQIRFHTNSFSAEYHEAGMIRVEVITKPGMGGWRGQTNFGFRDESLNAKNYFADEKGAEQMRRYMLNFQGPIVKNRTSLTMSFDGNSSYDSRTINALSPSGSAVTGLAQAPTDAMNFMARVEHLTGATGQLQAEYSRRQNDRSNIGVGDFDLPERAYATENSTDTFRLRSTNVIGKKVFSEFRFSVIDSTLSTSSLSTAPAIRVNEAFTAGGAGQMGDRSAREIEIAQNFDFSLGRKHSMRAGVLFESGWWNSNQRSNAFGTYTFTSLEAYRAGLPATYSIRTGDPVVDYSQVKAGWFLQDDFRPAEDPAGQPRRPAGNPDAGRREVEPCAARRDDLERDQEDHGARRLRHLLRLVRLDALRADDSRRRQSPDRRDRAEPDVPGHRRQRHPAARQRDSCGLARAADHSAGIGRPGAAARGVGRLPRRLHVDARQQHAALDQRQRAGQRRSAGSVGRQHHRDPVVRQARVGSRHRGGERALRAAPHHGHGDVSAQQRAQLRRQRRPRCRRTASTPTPTGVRRRRTFATASSSTSTRRSPTACGWASTCRARRRCPTTSPPASTTMATRCSTIAPTGSAATAAAAPRSGPPTCASTSRSASAALRSGTPTMPMPPPPPPAGGAMNQRVGGGPGGGGGDGPQMVVMEASNARYRLDVFLNIQNAFNNVNYNAFIGNQLSPFFGTATSAGAPRRVEVGFSLGF